MMIAAVNERIEPTAPAHIGFLDGIRALAALWVMVHHFSQIGPAPWGMHWFASFMSTGYLAVPVFIVLSGYSLMLPVLRADGALRDGAGGFLRRRFRRILPAYYAAVAATVLFYGIWDVVNKVLHKSSPPWGDWAYGFYNVLTHLLMIHNLFPQYRQELNAPMWSVGTEMDIYFLFPVLLLPLWRRYGPWIPIVLYLSITAALPPSFGYLYTWFVGLFAAGMAAASLRYSHRVSDRKFSKVVRTPIVPIVLTGLLVWSFRSDAYFAIRETSFGLMAAWLMFRLSDSGPTSRWGKVLSGPTLTNVAKFSYSLYLTHSFFVVFARSAYPHVARFGSIAYFVLVVLGCAVSILFAARFSNVFEYPKFLYRKQVVAVSG